jgi:HEAT repeat protein
MMKDTSERKKYQFEDIKKALLNQDQPFPPTALYFFSDILQEDLDRLVEVWPQVLTDRRRALLEDMENLAEADTLLYFDSMAEMCLSDEDPVARATAIRLLWQSQNEDLVPKFLNLLQQDAESIVRAAAATALGLFVYLGELDEIKQATYQNVVKQLIHTHTSTDDDLVRRRALEALGYASHPDVPRFIQQAYNTQDDEWLQSALFAMGRTFDRRWVEHILTMMGHPDNLVRYEAVRAAGELEAQGAREALFDLLEGGTDDDDLYFAAIWSLSKIGGDGVRNLIEMALEETDDPDEIDLFEEALENLDFTEQVNMFGLMNFEEDDPDAWDDLDDEDYPFAL